MRIPIKWEYDWRSQSSGNFLDDQNYLTGGESLSSGKFLDEHNSLTGGESLSSGNFLDVHWQTDSPCQAEILSQ